MTMLVSSSNATVSSQSPPPPTTTASTAIHTPSLFATTDEMPSGPPPSRSFSVMAPTELQRSVQRQYDSTTTAEDLPWWQHYYQMYHYHPPQGRKPTLFGPYLLLHTLGEGEFGKVKLGIHVDSSQEASLYKSKGKNKITDCIQQVAIKLIKKDNIDSSTRMSKVEREISVLRVMTDLHID